MSHYLLVDVQNLSARNHHAQNELSTINGTKTGAIYGSLKGISWVRHQLAVPLYTTVMLWDGGHAKFRKALYPDYKAGRKLNEPKTPEQEADSRAYRFQLKKLREILSFTEAKQVRVVGMEADDLISIFATLLRKDGHHITVFSGDHDMHQLAEDVDIFDPKMELYTKEQILEKWKLQRIQDIPLKKAIWGDTSDNIKGIHGLGDKRASIACCFLEARDGKVEVRRTGWSEKDGKIIDKVLLAENQKIIERNLKLMDLPRDWMDSGYTLDQAEQALVQFLETGGRGNFPRFVEALKEFEMDSILEKLGSW